MVVDRDSLPIKKVLYGVAQQAGEACLHLQPGSEEGDDARCGAAFALLALAAIPARAQSVAIVGATVIDGTGADPVKDAVLVIDAGKITAVGPRRAGHHIPRVARQIDAAGSYVIPGLMDANVHLVLGSSIEFIARYEGRYEDLIEEAAQVTLKNGLTTVFDSWGPLQPLLNVRDRIRRGETTGSRVQVAGNIVGLSGPFGRDFNQAGPDDGEQARTGAARQRGVGRERRSAADVYDARSGAHRDSCSTWGAASIS